MMDTDKVWAPVMSRCLKWRLVYQQRVAKLAVMNGGLGHGMESIGVMADLAVPLFYNMAFL